MLQASPRRAIVLTLVVAGFAAALAPLPAAASGPATPAGPIVPFGGPVTSCLDDRFDAAPLPGGGRAAVWTELGSVRLRIFAGDAPAGPVIAVALAPAVQGHPVVAADPWGRLLVVWSEAQTVRGRRFDSQGGAFGPAFEIARRSAGGLAATYLSDGSFVVAWTAASGPAVERRRFGVDSTPAEPPVLVEGYADIPGLNPRSFSPALAAGRNGDFLLVWSVHKSALLSADGLDGRLFRPGPAGVTGLAETRLDLLQPADALEPAVAPDGRGGYVLAWRQEAGGDGLAAGIFARRFAAAGTPLGAAFRVDGGAAWRELAAPDVAQGSDGDLAFAWAGALTGEPGGSSAIWARTFGPAGSSRGPAVRLSAGGDEFAEEPVLLPELTGRVTALWVVPPPPIPILPPPCTSVPLFARTFGAGCDAVPGQLCLHGGRFAASVAWVDAPHGRQGDGQAVRVTPETGWFWFFSPENVELMVKILDARDGNGSFWVFFGALSDVAYDLQVTDLTTGVTRGYTNPHGQLASRADVNAFQDESPSSATAASSTLEAAPVSQSLATSAAGPCDSQDGPSLPVPTRPGLCLGHRFEVEVAWHDTTHGTMGNGEGMPLTTDSGAFWFFAPQNLELVVKVLDARTINGSFWVFSGALSDVEYTITVRDRVTGIERTYHNPPHTLHSFADTSGLPAPPG